MNMEHKSAGRLKKSPSKLKADKIGPEDKSNVGTSLRKTGRDAASTTADRAIQILGVEKMSNPELANADQTLIRVIRSGVPKRSFDRLVDITGIAVPEMAKLLHISDRTLRRYTPDQEFSQEQGERIVALANLYSRGEEVFESIDRFNTWMGRGQIAFGNESPKSYMDTSLGIGLILDELGRIEHGILA